jgi:hypothetical protein
MKRYIRNIAVLISPILLMIMVNEMVRPTMKEKPFSMNGLNGMNSDNKNLHICSWSCYLNTTYCKENHVKFLKPYYKYTDPIYFGIISFNKKTGNYVLANIIFLVLLLPLLVYGFVIKSMNIQDEINQLKTKI